MRLATPRACWALLLTCCLILHADKASATFGAAENVQLPDSLFEVSLLDVWAGVSSFHEAFSQQSHVAVAESAWIEREPIAQLVLNSFIAARQCCDDFYSDEFYYGAWREWRFDHDLIVTAGPSCCPLSISGKRKRHLDSRASQGLDTARLAIQLGALVLIVENVAQFWDEDHIHGLVAEMNKELLLAGFVAVGVWRLLDSQLGGATGRERVFLRWERKEMASCMPPLNKEPAEVEHGKLVDFLDPVGTVRQLEIGGQSFFQEFEIWEIDCKRASKVGELHIRGDADKWMEGEALKLPGDCRLWRELELSDGWSRLIFDCRSNPKFRWVRTSSLKFSQRQWLKWPVYSIDGVAKALRHTNFAPGDLYLDTRDGRRVRPLSGRERWRLMGLHPAKAELLIEAGLGDQLGQLAGNSIPVRMTAAVAADEAKRVSTFKWMVRCRERSTFCLMPPVAALHCESLCATFLLCLGLAATEVLVWDGGCIPGMVHEVTQKQAFGTACSWAAELGCPGTEQCILLERDSGNSRARTVIWYDQKLSHLLEANAVKISDVLGLPVGQLAVDALAQVQRMVSDVVINSEHSGGWQSGRVAGSAAYQHEQLSGACAEEEKAFLQQMQQHEESVIEMRSVLEADGSDEMLQWMQMLSPTDLAEFPAALRRPMSKLDWCGVAVPDPHVAVETDWQPLPGHVELPERPAQQGWLSAVRPGFRTEARRRVKSFQKKLTKWLDGKAERPAVTVIPGKWLEHWVFQAPHEFHSKPGWAVPVDLSKPSESHLNLEFYKQQGECYLDQELISFLVLGVRYKADLPTQIVLQPHLQSFLPVQSKYLEEADRFELRRWTVRWPDLPLVPFFSAACGSVCRPLEPDRPRCTNDAGAPRTSIWDDDGIRVVPLNETIERTAWPKKVKPDSLTVVTAMRILKEAADILGMTIFVITDDYKSFFNQCRLAPSEYSKTGVMHPPRAGEELASFAYDTVLGFGIKMASNVAQRFADFLVTIFKRTLLPKMESIAAELRRRVPEFNTWWAQHVQIGTWQAALCFMFMYCDDPIILTCGTEMTHEALKVWTWMAKSGNTMMAIPEKRGFGLSAKWIGVKFFVALGVAAVTAQKVMRACSQMTEACSSSLNKDQYRSLIGFLEHVRGVLFMRGDKMYGLYGPLSSNLQPAEMVACNGLMEGQFNRMKHRPMVQAGSSVEQLPAFLSGAPLEKIAHSVAARRIAIFSDAAKEGTETPGLGGWIVGYCWVVPLTAKFLQLDIPILEGIAAVVNVVCAHNIMGGTDHLPADTCFEAHVDAQATVQVLIKGRAKSPMMQFLHARALEIPAFCEMLPFLLVCHILGLGNVASDACSRGYTQVLKSVAATLAVRVVQLDPPQVAYKLLQLCLAEQGRLMHEHCWGHRGECIGEADFPGPFFQPMQSSVAMTDSQQTTDVDRRGKRKGDLFQPMQSKRMKRDGREAACKHSAASSHSDDLPQVHKSIGALGAVSVQQLAQTLWMDHTEHAICRGNWEQLVQCCEVALSTAGDAFAQRTAEADRSHFKVWQEYCSSMGTSAMRPVIQPLDRMGYLREVVLLVNALTYFMRTRRPRSSKDSVIKPQSAMNILLAVNRVLKASFSSLIPLSGLKLSLRGLMRRFVQRFGPSSLIPKRREPLSNGMIQSLVNLPANADLGPIGKLVVGSIIRAAWRAAVALATASGFRKAELFKSNDTTFYLLWSNIAWVIQGKIEEDPTEEQLAGLTDKDYLAIKPPPSKADQMNQVWGAHPHYIPFRSKMRNAAAALRDLALLVGHAARATGKAVFVGNSKQPLVASSMATAMHKAMSMVVGPQLAKLYTWHSARISLATHLLKCNVPPATIQALLRWQTDESLRAYARLSMQSSAKLLDQCSSSNIASVQTGNMPIYEHFEFFLAMHRMTDEAAPL